MPVILLVLGLVIAVLGAAMIAYGIPINEFSFGNTLIVAGMVALVGGLILIGVASAARQLRRIADNLDMQPMSWSLEAPSARRTASVAPPPVQPEPAAKEPEVRPQERVVPPPVAEPLPDKPASPEQAAEPESAAPPRGLFRRWFGRGGDAAPASTAVPEPPAAAPPAEPRVDLAPLAQLPEPEPAPRVPPVAARPAPASAPISAPMPIETKPERLARPIRPAGEAMKPAPRSTAPAATIFKSGVIDGMAYTLYTDGSIEAELAQGKVRFATVEELQNYLLRGKGS
jgi:hypothetical protein